MQIPVVYRNHERQKRNEYEERIREVDKGSFTPLVFSSSGGGAGPAATTMLKRLANIYAEKRPLLTAKPLPGCGADWLSPFFDLQSSA